MRRFLMSILAGAAVLACANVAAVAAPPMWLASDDDSRVWLFGSLHAMPPDIEWRTEALDAAIAEAELYYYEAPIDAQGQSEVQAAAMKLGLNPAGERLTGYLGEDEAALLRDLTTEFGVPLSRIEVMRPWLASLTLSVIALQVEGFSLTSGVELALQPETPDRNERYFETPAEQLHFFADLPHDVQVGSLGATLHQLVDMRETMHMMVEAWRTGDVNRLSEIVDALDARDYPQVREAIITRRNQAWVEELDEFMRGSDDALVVVGAGHLIGDESLPELLSARGYTIERVQ